MIVFSYGHLVVAFCIVASWVPKLGYSLIYIHLPYTAVIAGFGNVSYQILSYSETVIVILYVGLGKLARHIAKRRYICQLYQMANKRTSCVIEPVCLVVGSWLVWDL